MGSAASRPVIVVPDDFPSVFEGSEAHERARALGELRVYTERGADDEAELARRIDKARVAVNIRAHARFTASVKRAWARILTATRALSMRRASSASSSATR